MRYSRLPDERIVYRLLTNGAAYDKITGKPLSGGFKCRGPALDGTPRDTKGLSVVLSDTEDVDDIKRNFTPKAIVSLVVGEIRDIPPLDVVQDAPAHANVIGLPAYGEDDAKAELLATKLRDISTKIYPI